MTLSERDERRLVVLSRAADGSAPGRLEHIAGMVLGRHDAAAMLVRAIAADDWDAWWTAREIVLRRGGDGFGLLDLIVEVGQQQLVRRGKPRTWEWPIDRTGTQVASAPARPDGQDAVGAARAAKGTRGVPASARRRVRGTRVDWRQ